MKFLNIQMSNLYRVTSIIFFPEAALQKYSSRRNNNKDMSNLMYLSFLCNNTHSGCVHLFTCSNISLKIPSNKYNLYKLYLFLCRYTADIFSQFAMRVKWINVKDICKILLYIFILKA